jgi:tetratricopeptide (TPR) repeat protein
MYLGVAQVNAGQYDLGIRQLRQAVELDPHHYRSSLFLGRSLTWIGRLDEALAALEKALLLNPESMEVQAMMASAMAAKGDRRGALKILKKLIALESHLEPAIMVAYVYARLGDQDEMYHWLHRAVERKSVPVYITVFSEEFKPYWFDRRFLDFLDSIGLPHPKRN